jgi:hypothetical protein
MRLKGRKRPADAELLLSQVSEVFKAKKEALGARRAADQLDICVASLYKYIRRENVPDIDVLRAATDKWGIKWKHLDPYEILSRRKVKTAQQMVFSYLSAMKEDDIEVVEVAPDGTTVLQIVLKIKIPT